MTDIHDNITLIAEDSKERIFKLAQDMVAAGNLNTMYGFDPFMKAKKEFEEALQIFIEACKKEVLESLNSKTSNTPEIIQEKSDYKPSISFGVTSQIPEFLKMI